MAEGNEPKPINMLVCQHQFTIPSKTINAGSIDYLINNEELSSLTFQTLDPLPTGRTLKGVVLLWASSSVFVMVDSLVSNNKVSLRVMNLHTSPVAITNIRILAFWE